MKDCILIYHWSQFLFRASWIGFPHPSWPDTGHMVAWFNLESDIPGRLKPYLAQSFFESDDALIKFDHVWKWVGYPLGLVKSKLTHKSVPHIKPVWPYRCLICSFYGCDASWVRFYHAGWAFNQNPQSKPNPIRFTILTFCRLAFNSPNT